MSENRAIFLILNGSRHDNGVLEQNYVSFRLRTIKTRPLRRLNGHDARFQLFEDLMRSKGYSPVIYEDGTIIIQMPSSDKYGPVLREIANVYYLAEKMEARR